MEKLDNSATPFGLLARNTSWKNMLAQLRKHKFTAFVILGLFSNGARHVVGPSTVKDNHHSHELGINLQGPETSNERIKAVVRNLDTIIASRVKEFSDPNIDPILRDLGMESTARLMRIQDRLRHFPPSENWPGIIYAAGKTLSLITIDASIDYPKRIGKGTFLAADDLIGTAWQEGLIIAYSKIQTGIVIGINTPIGGLLSIFSKSGRDLVSTLPVADSDTKKFAVGVGEIIAGFALINLRSSFRSLIKAPFRRRRQNDASAPTPSP